VSDLIQPKSKSSCDSVTNWGRVAPFRSNGKGQIARTTRTLEELAELIEAEGDDGDKRLLAKAQHVRELKLRIEEGEAGLGVKWAQWGMRRFGRGKTWLYEMNTIASAKNPEAALAAYHNKNSERGKRYNDRIIERNPERAAVIRLIRKMNIEQVRKIRKTIAVLTGE